MNKKPNQKFVLKILLVVLSSFVVIIICLTMLLLKKPSKTTTTFPTELGESAIQEEKSTEEKHHFDFADIKGAVQRPGMYPISENMRVFDLIASAGGFTEDADQTQVNLAEVVGDQLSVYVPKVGEEMPQPSSIANEGKETETVVNINTGDANELQRLNGIGEKKAALIIQYREEHGNFREKHDLTKVKGIGEKSFDSLKESITIK